MRSQLDRLFARPRAAEPWTWARDAWSPPWQPRGRWWMRAADKAARGSPPAAANIWRRVARPARIA